MRWRRPRPRDRQSGRTEPGPHRAEIVLRLDERRVQDEASRGQQKLTAAALILAQVALESADRPLRSALVVDDPAAELDAGSLERLLAALTDLSGPAGLHGADARSTSRRTPVSRCFTWNEERSAGYNGAFAFRDR